ncbi:MAG: helix-turn-helix transcriptional regulator [Deltaproteobacteria bacterium]|nr:helix-turn-helix transcriptional regulator [Deltaproteobacteria bacterium]
MAKAETVKSSETLACGFEAKIRDARYLVGADRFTVTFDNGKEYSFLRSLLECDDGSDVTKVEVDAKRFFFHVSQASGNKYEVPWDRVLHESEPSYPYFRGRRFRVQGAQDIGKRITKLRKAKGMTQAEFARACGILRPNLSRIEAGKHRPTLETLEKIAAALRLRVVDILARR